MGGGKGWGGGGGVVTQWEVCPTSSTCLVLVV